jgi:hypothetical protein
VAEKAFAFMELPRKLTRGFGRSEAEIVICRRLNSVCVSAFFHATSKTISTRTPVGTTSDKLALLQTTLEVGPFDGDPKGDPNGEGFGVKCGCN